MNDTHWITTYEDKLLARYLDEHPGELFLEVPVGEGGEGRGPRRIDGVLVRGPNAAIHSRDAYSTEQFRAAVHEKPVHVLEAKRVLNRNVIGQVQVGEALLKRQYEPSSIVPVAVCGGGNPDLAWYCEKQGVEVVVYENVGPGPVDPKPRIRGPRDVRRPPDPARKEAFMRGWDEAVDGRLFRSVRRRITHTNMGNLFGWIYGDQSNEFREATWARYVAAFLADRGGGQES